MVLHLCAVYVLGFEPFSFVLLENKTKQSAMFFWATLTIYMRDQWNKIHKRTKFRNRKKQSLRNRIEGTHKKGGNGNLYYAFPSHVKWISHNFHDSMEEACMQDKKKAAWMNLVWWKIVHCSSTAEADVEFSTKLSARGLNDVQISELQKPSSMITSLEDYVRNAFTR